MKKLRIIRILLAAFTFAASWCAAWFMPKMTPFFTSQFGSSALAMLSEISLGAVFAVVGITIVTLLIGRVYCSVLCPLGIMQDIFAVGKRKYRYLPHTRTVKYMIFIIGAAMIAFGVMLPWTLLMPSANFVQIVNYGFREAAYLANVSKSTSNPALAAISLSGRLSESISPLINSIRFSLIYCFMLFPKEDLKRRFR